MKKYDIIFRSTPVTNRKISINIKNFFAKKYLFNDQYIILKVNVVLNNKNTELLLSNKYININDKKEIKILIKNILEQLLFSNITLNIKDKISILYIVTNENNYINYINSIKIKNINNFSFFNFQKLNVKNFSTLVKNYTSSVKSIISLNKWYDYTYKINDQILLAEHIEYAVKNFWLQIVEQIEDYQYILIQFKLKTIESEYRTVSYVQTINKNDLDDLILIFKEYWNIRTDDYHILSIDSIIFTYKILTKQGKIGKTKIIPHNKILIQKNKPFSFSGISLPNTMDITKWSGKVIFNEDYNVAKVFLNNSPKEYHIQLFENFQIVKVIIKNKVLLEFKDIMTDKYDLSTFVREIKTQKYYFQNNNLILKQVNRKVNYLTKIEKDSVVSNKYITMDLETRNINGTLEPICISTFFVDGNEDKSENYYLNRFTSPENMLKTAIESLLRPKFNDYKVYLHNFSNFDGIFMIKILSEISTKVKPIIKDGRIINISVKYGKKNNYTLHFRDSYLILPSSLDNLAKNFNLEINKEIFPHKFVNNPDINLSYKGQVPDINYFYNITKEEYKAYCQKRLIWDLKNEITYYCEIDSKVLFLVLNHFSKIMFEMFKVDIFNYPTLPSLTLAIFRSNFLKKDHKIPLIDNKIYKDICEGYTGGMVDVYKPTNKPETKVYSYDINSLYPYVMSKYPIPVGNPIYFEGDILKINSNPFGIFYANVTAPNNLNYPILQTKITGSHKTITPIGNWSGWYNSEELFNAIKFGYSIKINKGYLFEKGYIFKEFVNKIYQIKMNSMKNTPNYLISKLLLNSLYGKLGTDPNFVNHMIIDSNKSQEYNHKYIITNVINLGNEKELISYFNIKDIDKLPTNKISSLPIAFSITAYARIHMSLLKQNALNNDLTIYYMDTDSLAVSNELAPELISPELGKFKLEHIFNEVIYLAPKVYGGKTSTYEITKVKGLKNKIKFNDLKPLLIKNNSIKLNQEKWFKNIGQGNISIKDEIYTLMLTENKRELIFDNNNIFIETKPIKINLI